MGDCWGPLGQTMLKSFLCSFDKFLRKNPKYMKSTWRKKES
jgi:hypothetical protein